MRFHAGDILIAKQDLASGRVIETADDIKAGSFSRTVGAYKAGNGALFNLDVKISLCCDSAKFFRNFFCLKNRLRHLCVPLPAEAPGYALPAELITSDDSLSAIENDE